jgi:hypothetical protein
VTTIETAAGTIAAGPATAKARTGSRLRAAGRWLALLAWSLALFAFVALPVRLLWPFHPQTPLQVTLAFEMRRAAPWVTALGLLPLAFFVYRLVQGRRARWRWIPIVLFCGPAGVAAWFAHQNHFEWMFHPVRGAQFAFAARVDFLEEHDMVLALEKRGDSAAYPVRQMAYHHLVNDTVGGEPVVATYCTLCHTGFIWKRTLDGRVFTFRLYGINNMNMVMRDEQTGSWWQQATGEAIQGPLKGRRLEAETHDEITFAVYRGESPAGRVLRPVAAYTEDYAPRNWERLMKRFPTVTPRTAGDPLPPRTHVLGITIGGQSRAYAFPAIRAAGPVNDVLARVPVLVVVAPDQRSARVFERTVDGRKLEFMARAAEGPLVMNDLETGSEWDFTGTATRGPLAGRKLARVLASKEYWFDWKWHRPQTTLYARGM